MSRETFVVLCAAAAAMCGCQSSKVKISGRIVGTEPRNIYLEEVTPLRQTIVDSTVLAADGSYLFRLRDIAASPSLYNVVYDNERIPLLVEGGRPSRSCCASSTRPSSSARSIWTKSPLASPSRIFRKNGTGS